MGTISLSTPIVGQPNSTEDPKIASALSTIQAWANGNIDSANVSAVFALAAGVNASQTVKGSVNITTSQSTGSTTPTLLATPDQVTNVVMPAQGLIAVWYQATWLESVGGNARAGIYLNGNQQTIQGANGASSGPLGVAAATNNFGGAANVALPLFSTAFGLASVGGGARAGDVTTGQAVGYVDSGTGVYCEIGPGVIKFDQGGGGACYIFAAAGSYTVDVRFHCAAAGTLTASNRRLWVEATSFA